MAIERTEIYGDFSALKTALETLVPLFFAEVELTNSNTISCKDSDGNTIFKVEKNSTLWLATAYRDATHPLLTTGYTKTYDYFYKVGYNGAFIAINGGGVITIAKANNGKTAFTVPATASSTIPSKETLYAACWGDDIAFNNPLRITDSSNPTLGNNCLFVPVPLYGNYQLANHIPKVFFMPVAQENMRGIVQEVTSDIGRYITDGYIAMIDDDE